MGSSTTLILSDVATIPHYTTSPYGSLGTVSYGLGISVQKETEGQLVFGIEVSVESLASRQHIRSVSGMIPEAINTDAGKHVYRTSFLKFFPSIGRSINLIPRLKSTVMIGPDLGIGLKSQNIYDVTIESQEWNWTYRTNGAKIDFRPRIEFINYLGKMGLSLGYSHGLTNYPEASPSESANSRYLRVGFQYRIR
ncbi:MAG TPA: hypothetical protein VK957_22755 [Lunatimonas sp.]|nr:hypothetical protein [Lunatimonas sp.]